MNARACCLEAPRRHARHDRVVIEGHGGWQVLIHPRNAAGYAERAGEGRLSLLLWHPQAHLSLLVPSAESASEYELLAPGQPLARARCYAAMERHVEERYGVALLPRPVLSRLYARFVLLALVGATRPAGSR